MITLEALITAYAIEPFFSPKLGAAHTLAEAAGTIAEKCNGIYRWIFALTRSPGQ
jgi:hypothetical protein